MRDLNSATFLAMLLLAATSTAFAQDLSQPITESSLPSTQTGLHPDQLALLISAPEGWRREAETALQSEPQDAASDFVLVARGVSMRLLKRDLAGEFLQRLSDQRMLILFQESLNSSGRTEVDALASLAIAREVASRPSLKDSHSVAAVEIAKLVFVTAEELEPTLAALSEARAAVVGGDAGAFENVAALEAALQSPATASEFAATIELLNLSIRYKARQAGHIPCAALYSVVENSGTEYFAPSSFAGDYTPLKALSRTAFELSDSAMLEEVEGMFRRETFSPPGALSEVLYWVAMDHFASKRYLKAEELFLEIIESGDVGYHAACSEVRLGQCYLLMRNYREAAVHYSYAAEHWQEYPEVVKEAAEGLEFLVKSRMIDRPAPSTETTDAIPTNSEGVL